jgi:hypothetical protein
MRSVAELIDEMLASAKTLGGVPRWEPYQRGEARLLVPLQIGGVSCGAHVEVNAYPNINPLRFRVMICAPNCIWRIDYTDREPHVNPLVRPSDITEHRFDQPHYHAWADNRQFSSQNALPDRLPVAKILPPIRQFDATFRWFCSQTNIAQPPAGLIELPLRTMLL